MRLERTIHVHTHIEVNNNNNNNNNNNRYESYGSKTHIKLLPGRYEKWRFEGPSAVTVFWDVMSFSMVDVYRCFAGNIHSYTMKKDSVYSSEMSYNRPHDIISLKTVVINIKTCAWEIYCEIGEVD
jgi:hypothetical protein